MGQRLRARAAVLGLGHFLTGHFGGVRCAAAFAPFADGLAEYFKYAVTDLPNHYKNRPIAATRITRRSTTRSPTPGRRSVACCSTTSGCRTATAWRALRAIVSRMASLIPISSAPASTVSRPAGIRWASPTPSTTPTARRFGTSGLLRLRSRHLGRSRARSKWA